MLEEEFEETRNRSRLFLIISAIALALLLGVGLLIWRTREARSVKYENTYGVSYNYGASQYGSCDGSCGVGNSADGGSCCDGSGLGGQNLSDEEIKAILNEAEKAGLAYYTEVYKDTSVVAKATDYGCHIQVDIYKGEKAVKSLGFNPTSGIYEIS